MRMLKIILVAVASVIAIVWLVTQVFKATREVAEMEAELVKLRNEPEPEPEPENESEPNKPEATTEQGA